MTFGEQGKELGKRWNAEQAPKLAALAAKKAQAKATKAQAAAAKAQAKAQVLLAAVAATA